MYDTDEQSARLSITQTTSIGIRVLVVSGEIDADNVRPLRQALAIGEGDPSRTVLDLGAVTFIDSSGIGVLAAAHRDAEAAGGWIRLAALSTPVERVVRVVGLDTIIACYPTLAQALAA
ncbi:STAS domain-containing protein [Streptomyces sp. NPDC059980]|uniref:STAS domain-containing protein n=1 Tax=Streptomyces sp. NPDC059980 TaxID=3347022 RepID=UPI0036A116D3